MPLSARELEQIQVDALADDIPLDLSKMTGWTAAQARDYFESGGEIEPAPSISEGAEEPCTAPAASESPAAAADATPDRALLELLDGIGGAHLAQESAWLNGQTLTDLCTSLSSLGRPAFLSNLKQHGVASLAHRQALANAVGRAARICADDAPPTDAAVSIRAIAGAPAANGPAAVAAAAACAAALSSAAAPAHAAPANGVDDSAETAAAACTAALSAAASAAAFAAASAAAGGAATAAAFRRRTLRTLPPHVRLTPAQLLAESRHVSAGEWSALPIPRSIDEMTCGERFGPAWLTAGMRMAGVLTADNAVAAITEAREIAISREVP